MVGLMSSKVQKKHGLPPEWVSVAFKAPKLGASLEDDLRIAMERVPPAHKMPTVRENFGTNNAPSIRAGMTRRMLILSVLTEKNCGYMDIVQKTGIPYQSLAGYIDRMEFRGLVLREKNAAGKANQWVVYITDAGRAWLSDAENDRA